MKASEIAQRIKRDKDEEERRENSFPGRGKVSGMWREISMPTRAWEKALVFFGLAKQPSAVDVLFAVL